MRDFSWTSFFSTGCLVVTSRVELMVLSQLWRRKDRSSAVIRLEGIKDFTVMLHNTRKLVEEELFFLLEARELPLGNICGAFLFPRQGVSCSSKCPRSQHKPTRPTALVELSTEQETEDSHSRSQRRDVVVQPTWLEASSEHVA